jgi:hypothetical protein
MINDEKNNNCLMNPEFSNESMINEEITKEYEKLMSEIKTNERLYMASHNFEPISGEIYHLYKKKSGEEFFSLISPEQWKKFDFIGSYRFLSDGRWEVF